MEKPRTIIPAILTDFRQCWRQLFVTHVIYSIVTSVLLAVLTGTALNLFLWMSGNKAVLSDQDILFFFITPAGLVTLIAFGSLEIAIFAVGYAALMTIGFHASHGHFIVYRQALFFVVERGWGILRVTVQIMVRAFMSASPFIAAGAFVFMHFLTAHDINYYLNEKPREFWIAGALIGAISAVLAIVLIRLFAGWIFALPLLLFEDVPASKALAEGKKAAAGHIKSLVWWLAGWVLASGALAATVPAITGPVGGFAVPRLVQNMGWLAFALGGLIMAGAVLGFLVSFINTSILSLLIVHLYRSAGLGNRYDIHKEGITKGQGHFAGLKMTRGLVGGACALCVLVSTAVGYDLIQRLDFEDRAQVMAHRGASAQAPENTLAAVEAAIASGAEWVEIDIQETADGKVVVIHDSDLKKIAGVDLKIWDATTEKLRSIDIGSWFSPEFKNERVPTLEQVLLACKGRIRVNIELKYYGHNDRLEERCVKTVESVDMASDIVVMSLDLKGIQKIRALRPGWKIGLLTSVTVGDPTKLDLDFLAVNANFITRALVKRSHKAGKKVFAWTVNDPVGMSTMMSRGVDGIITDEPAMAVAVLDQRKRLSPPERLLIELAAVFGMTPKYLAQ